MLIPNWLLLFRWAMAHPQPLAGVGIFSLVTAPGLVAFLVLVFTPSHGASWLARHFTLAMIIYAALFINLQGAGCY